MAGNEGSGQTDLLTGWSCVVHRPSEDPEPSELPSTVDMAAFSSGITVEPAQTSNNVHSFESDSESDSDSNNSGTDISGSCSQSDSSDSETSSSSQGSSTRSSSPEFSVTSSQTNGLRLKIATVRKSCTSPVDKQQKTISDIKVCDKSALQSSSSNKSVTKSCNLSSSSESHCSKSTSDSSSDSDTPSNCKSDIIAESKNDKSSSVKKPVAKVRLKDADNKKIDKKPRSVTVNSPKSVLKSKTRPKRTRKMASLPMSRCSTGSSSDSEDGSESDRTMLASCSLQEIRQEDLAAILPDQQECDAFGDFDCRADKNSPHTGDGSGSDMELPQQAVNALIQRTTESSSESESRLPLNPNTLYSNSLLQQFVAQTQMLNAPSSGTTNSVDSNISTPLQISTDNTNAPVETESAKRKRGRPKKSGSHKLQDENKPNRSGSSSKSILNTEYCGNPNVSPDSGIQNSSDHVSSPEPSPNPNLKPKFNKSETSKHMLKNSIDNKSSLNSKSINCKLSLNKLKEQSKLSLTSNSFDRVLYGNTDRVLYPPRRKAGRPPITRKGPGRPPKHKPIIATSSEGKPSDSCKIIESNLNLSNTAKVSDKIETKSNKHKKNLKNNCDISVANLEKKDLNKKVKSTSNHEGCEKTSKRIDVNNKIVQKCESKVDGGDKNVTVIKTSKKSVSNRVVLANKNKTDILKAKYTTLKNSKVMHSRHKDKKHKKCKFKILKPISAAIFDPKLNTEIEKLVSDFGKYCNISLIKQSKENVPEILKVAKKSSKKRKASDYSERKKKKQNVSNSFNKETNSNEQRLPLKKRHYHVSTNESTSVPSQPDTEMEGKPKINNSAKDNKNTLIIDEHISDTKAPTEIVQAKKFTNDDPTESSEAVGNHINEAIEACITKYSSTLQNSSKMNHESIITQLATAPINKDKINSSNSSIAATTPKKRHRLEAKNNYEESLTVNDIIQNRATVVLEEHKLLDNKISVVENCIKKQSASPKPIEITQKKIPEKKNESVAQIITRKKNRLEDLTLTLASKVNSTTTAEIAPENHLRRKRDIIKLEESYHNSQKLKKDETVIESATVPKIVCKVEEDVVVDSQKRKRESKKVNETERNQKCKKDILKYDLHDSKRKKDTLKEKDTSKDVSGSNLKVIKKDEDSKSEDSIAETIAKRKKDVAKPEESTSRASVIKSPISKRIKPTEPDKLDSITTDVPTGIFMPTIDIELHIPSSTIPNSHALQKSSLAFLEKVVIPQISEINKPEKVSPLSKQKDGSEGVSRKKIRKRRAINRTGFPTIKKKKKKIVVAEPIPQPKVEEKIVCDRVPQEGEKYSTFLQRTEKLNVSNTILEKLQNCINSPTHNRDDQIPKYNSDTEEESMYELGISKNGRPMSRQSLKNCRSKDVSPDGSTTDKNLRSFNGDDKDSNADLDDLSLEARLDLIKTNKEVAQVECKWRSRHSRHVIKTEKSLFKQNLRDFSPASSVDTFNEKKSAEEVAGSGDEKRVRKLPRWRKKFLIAGLFSDYYKEDDEVIRAKRTEAASKSSKIIYNSSEHPYGLLPPPYHCGRYLRCRKIPFQLPHDLWWQHTHSQLPGRDIVPSWNYRKIRSNVYNVKVTGGACEPQACNCSPTKGCDDDCINRLVLAECPATHKCQNQKIQKHEWSPGIERFMTVCKGWGIRTKLSIKQHEFILEYVGEVVSDQEFKERMATRYAHDTHHYCLHLDGGLVIDGHRMGGDGRFVNHSCEPNCEMQKWSVNGQFRMALFALRNIQEGEELTYDYNFSLFNPAEGQECKCGSENCRGVIGGKSQRVRQNIASSNSSNSNQVGRVGRPRKNQAKRTTSSPKEPPALPVPPPVAPVPLMKPMNNAQKMFVREHHCFIIRNLNKTKHNRDKSTDPLSVDRANAATPTTDHNDATTFINHLNALRQPRNMKTRRLAQAEDNPELKKVAQLASILRDLYTIVTTAKDEKEELLCSSFMTLPSKRKVPEYYQRITEPLDFATIEQNISMGVYRTVEYFDKDMNKIFMNTVRFFGRTSEIGIASARLKKIYGDAKQQSLSKLEEVIGEKLPSKFISSKRKGDEEDVIRCICGMFRDEGLMIQCERCLVWQHCECVQADVAAASYHCERCVPREVDYEIPLDEYTEHGHRYYMTLMRGDLQLRQGDTVYVLRDIPIQGTNKKHTYKTIGKIKYTDLDIFRIERLWKDCNSGQRFAYGHHYLRPHETFHEPTRKFFPNEVMRVPLYEAVPVELVISHCWVFDINTYCKGRPIGAPEDHIYICEYRVDKSARLFSKISKAKYPICTKSYAFDRFDVRLKLSRTYTPHDLDPAFVKPRGRKPQDNEDVKEMPQLPVHVPVVRTLSEKKVRLNKILLILLNKIPAKQALDVSYLLEGGRRRKKQLEK